MLVGRSGLSPVMVGRTLELDRLARLLGGGSAPAIALIGGEGGVGKTRMIQELLARVPAGTCVLAGQADPGTLGRPFELLLDAVDGHADDHAELIAAVTDPARAAEERVRTGLELVHRVMGTGPAVVIFEDLHWADSESVALFERLAEPDGGNLLLIGTYRPDRLTRRHPVADLLPRLERRHSVTHLRLDRLTAGEVSSFLAAVYGRPPTFRVVEALHTRTGGNPFFLEELLAASGDADLEHLCSQPLPWSLAEVVRSQLDDLGDEERRVVEAASVLGRKVPFDLLATVTRATEDQLIGVLRDLVHRGLMIESDDDVFSFRHALARETIEGELLGRERRRLHQAAFEALQEAGSTDTAAIARHAQGAGRYAEMIAAARHGAVRYLAIGSSYQALHLAELGLTEADDDLVLLGTAARAAWLAGLVDDAQTHADRWFAAARAAGDLECESAALRLIARLRWESADTEGHLAAAELVKPIIERLPRGEEQGRAMAAVAQVYMLEARLDEALDWAERAAAVADELDLPDVRLAALVEKGSALVCRADTAEEGLRLLEEVADEAERLGEDVIASRAVHNQVRPDIRRPDPERARRLLNRMRKSAERAGFDAMAGSAYAQGMADLDEWEGDLAGAVAWMEEGRRSDRGYLQYSKGGAFHAHEAGLAIEAGDLDRAAAVVREMGPRTHPTALWYRGVVFHVACRRGDVSAARAALPALLDAVPKDGAEVRLVHDVGAAAFAAGLAVDEMRPLFANLRLYDGEPLADDSPWRALLDAQVLEAERDIEGATALYVDAAAGAAEIPAAPRGTAYIGAARGLIALGRLPEAQDAAERAQELLARWGGWRRAELDAVLRRLGVGDVPHGPDSLTPREREVVALLAEGLSNAELADRLYISRKTAAVHVSNILAKLGMTSRTEIAAFAVREGLGR